MITVKIPADIYEAAGKQASTFHSRDSRQWLDIRDEVAVGMFTERTANISKLKALENADLSLLYRSAYSQHIRSILTMGEKDVPPSIHYAACEVAAAELKARLIDAIEGDDQSPEVEA